MRAFYWADALVFASDEKAARQLLRDTGREVGRFPLELIPAGAPLDLYMRTETGQTARATTKSAEDWANELGPCVLGPDDDA